jgi:hypothetical protein
VERGACHGVHMRFCYVFDGDWNVVVPGSKRLVVGCGHEASVFVDESDSVYGCEMVVVLLDYFSGPDIELDDLFVGHTSQEFVGVFW